MPRAVAPALVYPLLALGPAWLGVIGLRAGWDSRTVITLAIAGGLLVQLVLEGLLPYRRDWQARRRIAPDLGWLGSSALVGAALDVVALAALAEGATRLSALVGGSLWPTDANVWVQLALAVFVADFGHYWAHRALHDVPWLWRFHALHHRPDHLHSLNFFRMHPVEIAVKTLANVTPLVLLGAPREVLVLWSIVSGVAAGSVNHTNVDVRTGWLDGWLSTPATHRLHHSRAAEERGNLGNVTLLYDRLFGTHRAPRDRRVDEVGL